MESQPTSASRAALFADALARHQRGDLPGAERGYREITAGDSNDVEAWQHLGVALAQQGRLPEAETALRRALELRPAAEGILYNLALALQQQGKHAEAVGFYQRILAGAPPNPEVLLNLGNAYRELQRFDDAAHAYTTGMNLAPTAAMFPFNLAGLHIGQGRLTAPMKLLRRGLDLQPDALEPRRAFAGLCELAGEMEAAVAAREKLVNGAPDRADLHCELILDLNLADGDDGARIAAACRSWHGKFAAPLAAGRSRPTNDRNPDRRLRIGLVGANQLRRHTLCDAFLPIIALLDPHDFEIFAYSDLPPEREDAATDLYKRCATWRRTIGHSDAAYADSVRQDGIDVLIDPVGFVNGSRLLALARRPAPIQISFPLMGTCGGDTMDYVVADANTLTSEAERHFSERVMRLPTAYCLTPQIEFFPPMSPLPAATGGGVITFGSMNSMPKLSPRALRLWGKILEQVPQSRLLIKAGMPFRDEELRRDFLARLEAAGIAADRVELVPWVETQNDHLAVYRRIDVALDSLPYTGVTTTYESLLMGVPVVTRAGHRVLDRYGLSILKSVGLEEGIAYSDDEYVTKAVTLASDIPRLNELRHGLRDRTLRSPACNASAFAASIGKAIRGAWREWCGRASP